MLVLTAFLAAVVPTVLYTLLIWWLDRYEKEPVRLLLAAFGWGTLPAIGLALLFEFVLALPVERTPLGPGLTTWALAPLVEEPVKAAALVALFMFARREFDGPLDGIVYGALVGFGFSMTENLLFFLGNQSHLSSLFWLRSVLFGLNHAFFTSIIGLALGSVRYSVRSWKSIGIVAASLLLAIVLHALHNVAVGYRLPGIFLSWLVQSSGALAILAVAVLMWRRERQWIEQQLDEEVVLGTISATDYYHVLAFDARLHEQMAALLGADWQRFRRLRRLQHAMTKLAFCKQQLCIGDRFHCCDDRDQLREEIVVLRKQLNSEGTVFEGRRGVKRKT